MLTGQQIIDRVFRLVGGPVHDKIGGGLAVANMGGRWVMSARQWYWSTRFATLDAVPGAERIYLPEDFGGHLAMTGQLLGCVVPTSLQNLMGMRENSVGGVAGSYYGLLTYAETPAGALVPALEIYPSVPTSGVTSIGRIAYTAAWKPLTSASQVVSVPWFLENLVMSAADAYALGIEKPAQAAIQARLAELLQGPEFFAAVEADDAIQRDHGMMPDADFAPEFEFPAADPTQVG